MLTIRWRFFTILAILLLISVIALYATTYLPFPKEYLQESKLPGESLRIVDRHGILLREVPVGKGLKTRWVELERISPHVVEATIAAEDQRFYSHPGIDPLALMRASWQNLSSGRIVSGGSTLTQQVVKNLLRYPRGYGNKAKEIWYALRLEHTLSKKEILALYLNIAPYGHQVTGIEAASRLYLGKPAAHLSISEAAFLAALPQAPGWLDPYKNPEELLRRRDRVLKRLYEKGTLSKESYQEAVNTLPALYSPNSPYKAPHFVDWALTRLPERQQNQGGEVVATLDLPLQEKVAALLKKRLEALKKEHVTNGAVVVMENRTGDIRVMVGSRNYFDPKEGQVNGALALRQPGSALKPFLYGLLFEQGLTPASLLPDLETHIPGPWGDYIPMNFDNQYHGPVLLRTALASSYNVPAVLLLHELGPEPFLNRLHRLGYSHLSGAADYYGPGLALGSGEVTLVEMVRAYSTLPNGGGLRQERIFAQEKVSDPVPIYPPQMAYLLTDILSDPEARAPGFGRRGALEMGMAVAAKTGTTSDFRDNWAMGYTRDYTVGVWVGNFNGTSMEGVSGITGAAPLLRDVFRELYKEDFPKPIEMPKGIIRKEVCALSGELPGPGCKNRKLELFIEGTDPTSTCSIHHFVKIDKRNGLLAGDSAPPEAVEEKLFEVFPPLFRSWAAAQGIPAPPAAFSMNEIELSVTFPKNGDIFRIDPHLPANTQAIPLRVTAGYGIQKVVWHVDGNPLEEVNAPFEGSLFLSPGSHVVIASAEKDGKPLTSRPVKIRVLE